MSGKMDWKKVQDESIARRKGTSSIKVEKTSPENSSLATETAHDAAQNNPVLRQILRDLQDGKYGKLVYK